MKDSLLAPLVYEGGCPSEAQDRGEYTESNADSPRPSGTPLINAGGKRLECYKIKIRIIFIQTPVLAGVFRILCIPSKIKEK